MGVGLVKSAKFSAQGVGADARINKTVTAGLKDTTIDATAGSKAALVSAKAITASALKTGAAALQLSGPDSFLTGVVAVGVNRIKDSTTSGVTYTDKPTQTSMNVGNLDISAASKGEILSVGMGASAAVKGIAAVGGSGSHNYIANDVTATIKNADISSTGNVGVVAQSDEAISNYAGVLDVAAGGQGVAAALGVTGSYNELTGKTSAGIENSNVVVTGSGSHTIQTASTLAKNTDDEKYMIDSAVGRNTWSSGSFEEGDGDTKKYGVSRLQKGRREEQKTGVVVDASATHSISSVMANGGVAVGLGDNGIGVSLAGVINLNYVSGETTAKVLDSQLNTDTTRSDVTVRAADYTNVAEFSGAASVSIGGKGAGAAGFTGTTNDVDRVTAAIISTTSATWDKTEKRYTVTDSSKEKNKVFANNFAVTADAKQAMSAFNLTGAVAGGEVGSLQTGDNVNTNDLNSSTVAMVTNATVRASVDDTQDETKGAKVLASHEEAIYNLNVEAGVAVSLDPRGAAGSLNVGYGTVNDHSVILADVEHSDIKVTPKTQGAAAKSKLSVGASNSSKLDATLTSVGVSAALFSGAVGSSIVVNHINTDVISRIKESDLEADTIAIDTTNRLKVTDATGTGAGALLAGIGVGVDVSTFNDSVSTILDKSMLTAKDDLTINTKTQREIEATVAGVGIGAGGISVNVLAVTVNEGIEQLGVAQDADGKDTSFSHTGTINQALSTVKKSMDTTIDDLFSKSLYGMNDQEKGEMKKRMKSDQKNHSVVTGTGLLTEVGNDSKLKVNSGALTITNTELNDADLNGGSGSMGAAAVNVADVVYHLNELNVISVKNSSLEGGRVSLATHQGNVTKNKDEAIHLQTVQAGAGVLAIGVGYAGLTTKGQTGVAVEQGVLTATNGDLTVKSTDDVRSKADMIGVSAGVVAIPVSVAHNTNIANNFVTIKGSTLSASVKETEENGGQEGQQTTEKTPAYINLQTERTGRVAAKTVGVGVGLGAVIVNTAKVYDKSTSSVTLEYGTGSSNTNTNDTNTNNTNNTNTATPNTLTADAIRLEAVNAPVVKAEAGGTGVALLGVSVMQSNAEAYSNATVEVADGYKLLGDAVLAQAVIGKEGTDMTHAETHGVSGTVISVAPNKAKAITETTARVNMGNVTYKTEKKEKTKDEQGQETEKTVTGSYTNLALITQNNASRRSILGNTTIGLGVSIGTGDAKATGNDKSQVTAKGGTDANAASKLKNLKISAAGNATANGFADGDSGGITAWGAAATITMSTKTTNTATLSGAWDVAENADIGSLQQVTSRGTSKTGAGGVISVTWANSDDTVEMNTKTELKEGTQLKAGQSYVMAANKVYTNAYEGENYNNHMNVGGVIQVSPDIKSKQEIKSTASIDIGKGGTDGSSNTPKTKVATSRGQVFDAHSDIDMTNKVEGKAGGLAEHIYTYTDAFVTSTNTITVNENAVLEQKGEYESGSDITLSSSDKIKMNLVAEAYTGGLEGMVRALVDAPVTRTNRVDVNGKLSSTYDTNIYAGVNPDGTKSSLNITALAEAHNNTVIPPYTSPEVDLKLKNNQQVKVGNTGSATSVRNINVTADNGTESIKKDTVAVYWLCLGQSKDSKTTGTENGQSKVDETNNNYVNVEGLLKTGIQNNVRIDIKGALVPKVKPESGQEYTPVPADAGIPAYNGADVYVNNVKIEKGSTDDTIIKPEDIKNGDMDYATQLGEQLAALEKLISDYGTDQDKTEKKTAAYLGYVQQRQRILEEMEKRGLFKDEPVPMYQKNADGSYKKDDGGNLIPVRDANGRIQYEPGVTKRVYTTKGFTISYVEIPDITVSGGSIVVWSDNLYGKGKLQASGAPQIQINNESNAYLKLNNITVGEEGGDIRFRGTSLSAGDAGKEQINKLNKDTNKKAEFSQMYSDAASGRESAITVLNDPRIGTGNTLTVKGNNQEWEYTFVPDVAVLGNVNNRHGLVRIENKQGNITIGTGASSSANVNGRMVQLIATRGSISQDYIDGILNIGGRPEDLNKTITASMIKNSNLNKEKDSHDYKPVNTTPVQSENAAGHIAGDSVYLAAADINVKGLIQSGYGKYVVDIAEDALSEANIERMKNNGSEVTINGRTLYKVNDGNKAVYNANTDAYEYVIQVYYDPQTKGLIVEDIDTKGGKIYLTGRISSTGNGRVFAADGGAEIAITNRTKADLSTGKILNNDIEGKISITDLARKTWTEYTRSSTNSMSIPAYEKYLKLTDAYKADFAKLNDTQKVAYLNLTDTQRTEYANPATTDARRAEILGTPTETQIAEAKIVSGDGLAHNTDTTPGGQYQVKEDLRYNWTEGNDSTTTRYYRLETKSLFWGGLEYDDTTNELGKLESSMPSTPKPGTASKLGEGNFVGGALDAKYGLNSSEFAAIFENVMTTNSRTVTGSGKESGDWWALWSNPTYWVTWTTKTGSTQSYTFSLKANKPIGVGFIGQKDGSISVRNTNTQAGNVNLNGNIANNTKDATLTVESFGGSIVQKSGTTLTTGNADLSAKNNIENIHIATMGDWIATTTRNDKGEEIASVTSNDRVNLSAVSYNAGNIDVDVVGGTKDGRRLSGNVVIDKLASQGQQNTTGMPGDVSLTAEGNITQFVSLEQRFSKPGAAGGTYADAAEFLGNDAYYLQLQRSNADYVNTIRNQFANRESDPDLTRKFAGFATADVYLAKDPVYQNKLSYASYYKKTVEDEFARYTALKQKFTDTGSGSLYTNVDAYLAKDADYQKLTGIEKQIYAEKKGQKFARILAEDTATVRGRNIRLTSTNGSVGEWKEDGSPDRAVFVDSVAAAFGSGEDTAGVNAQAQKHIYLAEKDGDMRVGSIIAREGDVRLEAKAGRLIDALPRQDNVNNVDENDLIHHWIDAGLIQGTSDYEGSYIKGLKQDAANYEAKVRAQYEEYLKIKEQGGEESFKKRFTDQNGNVYETVEDYLAQDATYQEMMASISDYEANVRAEFDRKDGNPALQTKYKGYASADAYLDAQAVSTGTNSYKTMLKNAKTYSGGDDAELYAAKTQEIAAFAGTAKAEYTDYRLLEKFDNETYNDVQDADVVNVYKNHDAYYLALQDRFNYYNDIYTANKAIYDDATSTPEAKQTAYANMQTALQKRAVATGEITEYTAEIEKVIPAEYAKFKKVKSDSTYAGEIKTKYQAYDSADAYLDALAKSEESNTYKNMLADAATYQQQYQAKKTAADAYLELASSISAFAETVREEFAIRDSSEDLKEKYKNFETADAYLNSNPEYQQMQTAARAYQGTDAESYVTTVNSISSYVSTVREEYAAKDGDKDLQAKYKGYGDAASYLYDLKNSQTDNSYKNLKNSSDQYEKKANKDFTDFVGGNDLRTMFAKKDGQGNLTGTYYTSANEYLKADATYQQLVKDTQASTNSYVRDLNEKFTAFKNGDTRYQAMFTRKDGTTYDSVSQYLLEDRKENHADGSPGYLDMTKAQTDYEVDIYEKFSRFSNARSNGALTDMFTKEDGTTHTADTYLQNDDTYKEMVKKYTEPEFAWTKDQLLYAIRNAIVNKETGVSAETQKKAANVQGRNVTLLAQGVGINTNKTTEISASELTGGTEASIAKMKQLANADATDVTIMGYKAKGAAQNAKGNILRYVTETVTVGEGTKTVYRWKAYDAENPSKEVDIRDSNGNILKYSFDENGNQVIKAYDADNPKTEVATDGQIVEKFVIGNLSPLGVYATGQVDVTGISQSVFIAGRSNTSTADNAQAGFSPLRVGVITTGGANGTDVNSDVRLYTQEGIYSALDPSAQNTGNIHAKDLIAYGGTKDIGTKDNPVTVNLTGDLLAANADRNVYIKNQVADSLLRLGSVYAGDTVHLESEKGFAMTKNTAYSLGYLNAGRQLDLITNPTTGLIGTNEDRIRILNNMGTPEQYADLAANKGMLINLTAKDAYVEGVNGTRGDNTTMRLGLVELTGNLVAHSESYLEAGAIRLADADHDMINGSTRATGNVELDAEKDVAVNGPVVSRDGNITVSAGTEARINDKNTGVYAYTGDVSITAGTDAQINGKVIARTGDIVVSADKFAHVKEGALVEAGTNDKTVAISGEDGVTLDGAVKSGILAVTNPNEVEDGAVPVYEGGGAILLTSENGSVFQEDEGVLVAASVTVTSGDAIVLDNEQNLFRAFTANGVERVQTDAEGNEITGEGGNPVKETLIDGSVLVKAHAGSNLDASVTHTVYGNVALKNMDAGSLTVLSDVTAKEGRNDETGSIVFKQQGDILVKGALDAAGSVIEEGYEETGDGLFGSGSIINENIIEAGQNVTLRTTSGQIHAMKQVVAETGGVTVVTVGGAEDDNTAGCILLSGAVSAGTDITTASLTGSITAKDALSAAKNITAETTSGNIDFKNNVTAGEDITVTSTTGAVTMNGGEIKAGDDLTVVTSAQRVEGSEPDNKCTGERRRQYYGNEQGRCCYYIR